MINIKNLNETEMYNLGYDDGYGIGFSDGCLDDYDALVKTKDQHYKRGFFSGYRDGFSAGYKNTNELLHSNKIKQALLHN